VRKDGRQRRGGGNVVWLGRGTVVTSLSSLALARSVSLGGSRPGHCRAAQSLLQPTYIPEEVVEARYSPSLAAV
jgi:hypothetical protein